ncbi:MAG TPA: P-II family nitrogen regulator [Chloroflexi bacterium]|nr:P-II family nitrogen regulator [Chloroflexota bacterium]
MKEIKAYVRHAFLEAIIRDLEEAGARDLTVVRVDALGDLVDYEDDQWHLLRKYAEKYRSLAKLEIVCTDDEAGRFLDIIATKGHSGESGDGRAFVAPIEEAVNIRTGQRGENAL